MDKEEEIDLDIVKPRLMSTAASLPSVVKLRFNRTSRRKPNFRR
jgi:hypothetical protein